MVGSRHGFIIHWIVISKNIKKVTEVINVKNWRVDNSRVSRQIVSLVEWNSSVSSMKSSIQSTFSMLWDYEVLQCGHVGVLLACTAFGMERVADYLCVLRLAYKGIGPALSIGSSWLTFRRTPMCCDGSLSRRASRFRFGEYLHMFFLPPVSSLVGESFFQLDLSVIRSHCGTEGDRIVDHLSDASNRAGPAELGDSCEVVKYKAEKVRHEEMVKMPLVDLKVFEVYMKSKEEHESHLKMNMELLKKDKFHVKPNKVEA
nr:hypothetical protein [Tanacetum cinerariifolium]